MPQTPTIDSASPREQIRSILSAQKSVDRVTLSGKGGPLDSANQAKDNFRSVARQVTAITTGVGKNIDIYV